MKFQPLPPQTHTHTRCETAVISKDKSDSNHYMCMFLLTFKLNPNKKKKKKFASESETIHFSPFIYPGIFQGLIFSQPLPDSDIFNKLGRIKLNGDQVEFLIPIQWICIHFSDFHKNQKLLTFPFHIAKSQLLKD